MKCLTQNHGSISGSCYHHHPGHFCFSFYFCLGVIVYQPHSIPTPQRSSWPTPTWGEIRRLLGGASETGSEPDREMFTGWVSLQLCSVALGKQCHGGLALSYFSKGSEEEEGLTKGRRGQMPRRGRQHGVREALEFRAFEVTGDFRRDLRKAWWGKPRCRRSCGRVTPGLGKRQPTCPAEPLHGFLSGESGRKVPDTDFGQPQSVI